MGACCSSNEHCPTPDEAPTKRPVTENVAQVTVTPPASATTTTQTHVPASATTVAAVATPTTSTPITATAATPTSTASPTSLTTAVATLTTSSSTAQPTTAATATALLTFPTAPTPTSVVRRVSRKLSISKGPRSMRVSPEDGVDPGDESSDLDAEDTEVRRREEPLIVLFHRPDCRQSYYDVQELKVLGTLGVGEYGKVELVQDPRDHETYALKTINKAHMKKMGKEETVKNEWSILAQLDHVFINKLYCALEDEYNIYLLLQPSMGGELFSVIDQRKTLDFATAQFYVASVVLAFEYMHEKHVIYRDLKPENILLDSQGYIQICDFGCAKKMPHMLLRTFSEVGTPAYSCPEMIAGEGHNNAMDWWDVGVLMFEMLTGTTPFDDPKGPDAMAERIRKVDYSFPSNFPKTEQGNQAKDFIKKLLQKAPEKRLGVNREALEQLKAHPVFKGLNWTELSQKRIQPPFVPPLKDKFDLTHFSRDE